MTDLELIRNWARPVAPGVDTWFMMLAALEIATRFRDGTGQELLDEVERFWGSMAFSRFVSSFAGRVL